MTDHAPEPLPEETTDLESEDPATSSSADGSFVAADAVVHRTGVPAVDEVLAEVDGLDDRPLDEHLATFERAHETLRSALDADPGPALEDGRDGSGDAGDPA
jgi:hypothetical protein